MFSLKRTTTMLALSMLTVACSGFVRAETSEGEKGLRLQEKGDKLMEQQHYREALKVYLDAKAQLTLAQSFGQGMNANSILMKLGNAYALTGNVSKAINYYWMSRDRTGCAFGQPCEANLSRVESREASMDRGQLETRRDETIASFGESIKRCATCKFSLPYWESLADLYRATGDADKATRTEAELALHREANVAYDKAFNKGTGLGFSGTVLAISYGLNGIMPPMPTEQETDTKVSIAERKAWHEKMVVYQKHNRPEYVAQTVQEMRNGQ